MNFRTIFSFEFTYQVRHFLTWFYFAVAAVIAFLFVRGNFLADAMYGNFDLNSPFVIAVVTVFCSLFCFILAATVAGLAGARDMETGMHPLVYTAPISKTAYLGGRFLAAFVINTLILLAVPTGILLAIYLPGVDAEVIAPFRLSAYLTAYCFIALPNAFVGTVIQFAWATLGRRTIAAYLGSVILFFVAYGGIILVTIFLERQDLAALFDVFAHLTIFDITMGWTPIEKNTRLIAPEGILLRSRLIWFGIALGTAAFTYFRFRFVHPTSGSWWNRILLRKSVRDPAIHRGEAMPMTSRDITRTSISMPNVPLSFGLSTHVYQLIAITRTSFFAIAKGRGGLILLTAIAALAVFFVPYHMYTMGTPLLPKTRHVLTFLTAPLTNPFTQWAIIPMLIVLYAGELVWREREAGLGEISDTAPVPEWVLLLGRFLGLGLVLVIWMALLTIAGMLIQVRLGFYEFEVGLYLKVLFGLQLPEYFLFALLALVVQGVVHQKYAGHMVALLIYAFIAFADRLGINHHLLVYGAGPGWSYSDMRGFGTSLMPWFWFKLYWVGWALLLVVLSKLFWVRSKESAFKIKLRIARMRFTHPTRWLAGAAGFFILLLGGFILYNTNVLNEYTSDYDNLEQRAQYELHYGRFKGMQQPTLSATKLQVEIYPGQRMVEIHGTYHLINLSAVTIDSIHLATIPGVRTGDVIFDRNSKLVIADDVHGHRTYALEEPLQPGDSLQLHFDVHFKQRGFGNNGVAGAVLANGTYFTNQHLLPDIGYQARRELLKPGERRVHGLSARPVIPTLEDAEGGEDVTGESHVNIDMSGGRISFEAILGTDDDQVAVAPGALIRTWTEKGRRYFHYATDAIGDEIAFFSAHYAVREGSWKDVAIQVYHHPEHADNVDRIIRSAQASLENYSREFGHYPFGYLRFVEKPGGGIGAHADAAMINYGEGFALFNPAEDPRGLDLPFAIIAHEVAHQWWGAQLPYAPVEGVGLLTESPAWYSALGVMEENFGREHMRRLLRFFRQPHPIPPIRQSVPLLRGKDPYAAYRKGPFALYGLSEYMGKDLVNLAYRRLLEKHSSGKPPLATSLDLYRELQAVTPDTLQNLLHDLFAANTVWELKTESPTAIESEDGTWQVTIPMHTRKVVVDPAGIETELPMEEWVQVGVFAPNEEGPEFGESLYLQMHRVRSGDQVITVTVTSRPADAGIDPYHLLIDLEPFDNVERVKIKN